MLKLLNLFIFFFLFQTLSAAQIELTLQEQEYLSKNPILKVANDTSYPPFDFTQHGEPQGYSIDFLKLLAHKLDIEVKFVSKEWESLVQDYDNGQLDLLTSMAPTKEDRKFSIYSKPYIKIFDTIITKKKDNSINSVYDIQGKRVALPKEWETWDDLKEYNISVVPVYVEDMAEALKAVSFGEADVTLDALPVVNYFINDLTLTNLKVAGKVSYSKDDKDQNYYFHFMMSKNKPLLKSILDKAIDSITIEEKRKLKYLWLEDLQLYTSKPTKNIQLSYEEKRYLDAKEQIKMCVLPDWLPFEQIDDKSKHKGIGADITELISKKIDKDFVLVPTSQWSQSVQNIRDRKCDVLPLAMKVDSRLDSMSFTDSYIKEPLIIATKNDKLFIKDDTQLSNKQIAVIKGYAIIDVLEEKNSKIKIIEVKDAKEALDRVSKGELYGYVDTLPAIAYYIQKYGYLDIKIAGKLDYDVLLSIASRNDEPLLHNIMQKALDSIPEEEIRTIVGKWIEIKVHKEYDYEKLLYIIGVFLIIVFTVLYKNRSIKLINKKLELINDDLEKAHEEILQQHEMVDRYVLILTTDLQGVITSANQIYCKTLGFSQDELLGHTFAQIRHPEMKKEFFDKLWSEINKNNTWKGEIKNLSKNGKSLYFNVIIEALYENGTKIGYKAISEDITDKKRIEELSITDKLTGIHNRLKLDELLIEQVKLFERYQTPFSIIVIDIDNFKSINDNYGHDVGDEVLQSLAGILKKSIRETDFVGRWGGEEFVIICQNTSLNDSYTLAEKLRKKIEKQEFNKIGHRTISLGITEFKTGDSISKIFKEADNALYFAKHNGKNRSVKAQDLL